MYRPFSKSELKKNRKAYEKMYDKRHLLVQIDKVMDWDYVYSLLKPFYSEDKV
ncbi:hypothetical protein NSS88_11500 [Geobacillus sp. FSL W8-1251]|uniref:hypothetical protein n=1 Tax=Geobacillus sp. FSL W8-1251 TaxID=2954650 RepID=UPI0030F8AA45